MAKSTNKRKFALGLSELFNKIFFLYKPVDTEGGKKRLGVLLQYSSITV